MKKAVYGISPLGPSKKVKSKIRRAVSDINMNAGEAVAWLEKLFVSRYGIRSESLLLANSLKELLYFIPRVLKPKRVIIAGPAPVLYRDAALSADAEVRIISGDRLQGYQPAPEAILREAGRHDIVVLANPNCITGRAMDHRSLSEMIDQLAGLTGAVVVDEALVEFTAAEGVMQRAAELGNVIVLRTTACYYGLTGLELAFAVASPGMIGRIAAESHWDVNLLAVEAARIALKDKTFRKLSSEYMLAEKKMYERTVKGLPGVELQSSDANVLLLRLPGSSEEFAKKAGAAGLAVLLCEDIEGLDKTFLRLSIMRHEHNLKCIGMLKRCYADRRGPTENASV